MSALINYIVELAVSFLAEGIICFILVGLSVFLLGLFFISYEIKTHLKGEKVNGTIIGAVKDVKVSFKGKKMIKKKLNSGSLWPVYEFTLADGLKRQQRGSTGGSHVYKYKTGQNIKLNVHHEGDDIFVRGSEQYFIYILGIIFCLFGGGIIYVGAYKLSPGFNISSFIWLMAVVSLLLRFKGKIITFIKDRKENKKNFIKAQAIKRSFAPEDLHPIEYYIEEREQRRRKYDKSYRN